MKKFIFIFALITQGISAQRIQNFNLILTNTIVSVRFTMSAGNQCSGYNILRCTDSLNYLPIYNYAATCGSTNVSQDFKFDDYGPTLNAVNFYKVELVATELSPPQRIYVPASPKQSMLVYPDPVYTGVDQIQIRIYNSPDQLYYGYLVSPAGRPVKELIFKTQNEMISMDVFNLENGLYAIWLTEGTKLYSKKFIVAR